MIKHKINRPSRTTSVNSVEEVLIHMKQVLIEEPFKVRVRQDAEIPTPR